MNKRIVSILLAVMMIFGSVASLAEPGDIIHTGLRKIYRKDNSSEQEELVNDILNGFAVDKFYREVADGKFVNIKAEEDAQFDALEKIVRDNGLKTAEEIREYITNHKDEVERKMNEAKENVQHITVDISGFQGATNAQLLTKKNYSTPEPGYKEETTKITTLNLPNDASSWVYKVGDKAFTDLEIGQVIADTTPYNSGTNIEITPEKYLLLAAVDKDGKLKAYASIQITTDMVKMPRIEAIKDESIKANFTKSTKSSGTTVVSGDLGEGNWKIAVLDNYEEIYTDSEFDKSITYKDRVEIVVANDEEVDSMNPEFKKHIIIYSEKDGKIEKYNIFEIGPDKISKAFDAKKLVKKTEGENKFNYTTPTKGSAAGTTKIETLKGLEEFSATKWMYALVKDETIPKLDRVWVDSVDYKAGQDISVNGNDKLMLLATDDEGKVKAYAIVDINNGMIKDPPADTLKEIENYSNPEKGTDVGTTKFRFLKYGDATLYYVVSDNPIDIPEKESPFTGDIKNKITPDNNVADNIEIFEESDPILKDANGFTRYMMVYAVKDNKVIAYKDFILTKDNVRLPKADELPEEKYKTSETEEPLKPGTRPNSTILKTLNKDGIDGAKGLKYMYKFVDEETTVDINEVIKSTRTLEAGKELTPAKLGECLLILLVDSNNRTKYYANIKLTETNTRVDNAQILRDGKNYSNPEPGTVFNSTKFRFLGLDGIEDATKFRVAISDTPFEAVEFNSEVEAFDYATITDGKLNYSTVTDKTDENGNILGVDAKNNKYLLLLATDEGNKVKGYKPFTLFENMIRGKEAEKLSSTNYTIDKGSKPGTIRFSKLSAFGVGNTGWMYKWAEEKDEFTSNPPFLNQIITDAMVIRTKTIDRYTSESIEDIKVGEKDNHGYILLLAVNGNRVVGYDVIELKEDNVQSTARILNITLASGSAPDSTKIDGTDTDKANKYKISTTPMDPPGPNEELPRYGVMDVPESKEIQVRVGEYLSIFNVDKDGKILGYKDFEIKADNIQLGTATLKIVTQTEVSDSTYELLEGNIKANAIKISVELENASWADVVNDQSIKNALLDGLKADGKEQSEWNKVIEKVKNDKYSISINRDSVTKTETITITTTATEDYDISEEQRISLTIPARAIKEALNPIEATGDIVIKPTIDAKISGTVVNNIRQSEINLGDSTIVIDIVDSKWIDNIETEENKNKLLAGFVGDGSDNSSWNKVTDGLKAKIEPKNVVLKGSQRIEITIPKNEVKFDNPETITLTIPKDLVEGAKENIVANPSFTIYPNILPVTGIVDRTKEVLLEAPNYVNALKDNDTWELILDGTTFKEGFSAQRDLIITDLPTGLKLDINKEDDSKLSIKLIGSSSKSLSDGSIGLVIKASSVDGTNYSDSEVIRLRYSLNDKVNLENNIEYNVQQEGISLVIENTSINKSELQYSTNSTNGINGDWFSIPTDNKVTTSLDPVTIYVRETKQTDNKVLVCKLENPAAPTGVEIETYKYGENNLTVTLNKKDGLEYSLGEPNEWKDVPDSKEITLNKNSTLLVREKAVSGKKGKLPSLPTAKLNGLYLGNVTLDVSQSKIIGANSQMKYKLSNDGTWNSISGNDPIIDFKEGNEVWICEAKNDRNAKELGTVKQASISNDETTKVKKLLDKESDTDGIYYHIGEKKIVNKTGINLQYNITKGEVPKGNWFDLKNTANNVDFIPGNVFVRKVDDGNFLPSNPVKIFEIAEPINPPTIVVVEDNKTLRYETSDGEYKPLDDNFEYKINNGEYQNGTLLATDPKRLGNITVYVKRKATKDLLESKEINFKFTENISLANIKVNVAENTIEGTTTKMEYRTDKNSPWKTANSGKTSINMYEGMSIWIRELDKPSTEKLILKDLGKMGEPNTDLKYNVAQKYIKNASENILEYRINDGNWNTINVGQTISIEFVPIKLSIRTKATMDKLASDVVDVIDSLGYPVEAPKVDFDDENNKVNSIDNKAFRIEAWKDYEFKLKTDSEWMPANLLKSYDLSGDKIVQIRKKGNETTLPSEIAEIVFTKNIDLYKVELRKSTPLKLLYTELEMEYQVYLKDKTIPTTWIKATSGTTVLDSSIKFDDVKLIAIRDARNINEKKYIGEETNLPVDLSKVTYEISDSGIKLNGITDRIKYKIGEDEELKSGENTGILEPVTITLVDTNYSNNTRTIVINERAETPEITVSKVEYTTEKDDIKAKLTIDDFDKGATEYSIDGGTNWNPYNSNTVEISKDDILVVRAKAISGKQDEGKLPSLPTAPLNGIFLGEVSINAEQQLILGTNNSMEYSLDSTDGKDGTWKQADSPNTKVELKENDKVWIREKDSEINVREIGTIGKEKEPTSDKLSYNIKAKTITNSTNQKLEYRIAGGQWVPINANENASEVEFKAGDLEFRKVATGANLPSDPVTLVTIAEAEEAPKLRTNNGKLKDIQYLDSSGWKDINTDLEYRVGANGEWKIGNNFNTDESIDGNTMIYFRKVATEKALPSKETSLTLTFANLKLNVAAGKIEGTTSNMEYNLNSIDGSSGTWQIAKKGATNVNFVEGMNIWFREKDKPLMKIKLVDNLEREGKPSIAYVYYNIAAGKIANSTDQNLEYRIASKNEKDWHKIDAKSDIYQVGFKPGTLEFRKAGTEDKLPSLPVTKTTIKAPESKPNVVTEFDVGNSEYNPKNSVKSINGEESDWSKFEYSIDNNPWKNGVYLKTEDLNRSIKVRIRKVATATELASQFETVDFKEVLNLAKVGLSTHVQPLELNGTTEGMKYAVQYKYGNSENETRWDKDEKNNRTIWFKCDNNNTKLNPDITSDNIIQLIIRDINQPENQYTVYEKTQTQP